jgi:glycosyltransferase involved in cell wall biosynthesis
LSGGEDKVVEGERTLLKKNGVEVIDYFISNHEIRTEGLCNKVKLGLNTIWSKDQYKKLKEIVSRERPDVVHFHNTFPLLSPSVYYACNKLNIPVVQTLHNYRLLCPSGMFLKDNQICQACLNGSIMNSFRYGCYRDSKIQTAPITAMIGSHRFFNTWNKKVDRFISLTEFGKQQFIKGGILERKIAVKPNFVEDINILNKEKQNYYLFVGRISKEKGLETLLESWRKISGNIGYELKIIGDGPLKNELEQKYETNNRIKFLGELPREEVFNYISTAKYVVVPSICYESFGMVAIEAFSACTPVIASKIGALESIVTNNINGFHFEPGNVEELSMILKNSSNIDGYSNLQKKARQTYVNNYTPEHNFKMLMSIYIEAIEEAKNEK